MRDYKKFLVCQKSHQLTLDVYKSLPTFPTDEIFGLTVKLKDPQPPSRLILRKVVVEILTKTFVDFFVLLSAPQMS